MTVQDLINDLSEFNPDSEMRFSSLIEEGRGVSISENSEISQLMFEENYSYYDMEENEDVDFPKNCVVLRLSGERTSYD